MPRLLSILLLGFATAASHADTYTVTLDPALEAGTEPGRLILFFITEEGGSWSRRRPVSGPFFSSPQPIASMAVPALAPGETIMVEPDASFPGPLDALDGEIRVQAMLDVDDTERSHMDGPGNVVSREVAATVGRDRHDEIGLTLVVRRTEIEAPRDVDGIAWVRYHSDILSEFYGRDVDHLAGVVLPPEFDAAQNADRRWPAVYSIPGYGGRFIDARSRKRFLRSAELDTVWIVLDPESPLGHHGFVDSPNHGPRARALVEELIPELERRFRLDARPERRVLTGHSSGAWSSLWLQLNHPETFGACWASAPDPVDFRAFQLNNLYEDPNLFRGADGTPRPSMRRRGADGREIVAMTVEQENRMERAIDPQGRSGQQWDAWEAMFSPRDPATGLPVPMFDTETGAIDRAVVEHWRSFDVRRLVTDDWPRYGPLLMQRVRLVCGTDDSFYLERAVRGLQTDVMKLAEENGGWTGPGYVELVEGANHSTVMWQVRERWNVEMAEYLGRD